MAVDASWTFAPGPILAVVGALALYVPAWRRARATAGRRGASGPRLASFVLGLVLALVALVSPVDALGGELALMHMVQHMILLDLASIALILGLTKVILRPATRRLHRVERAAGPLAHPGFAIALYVGSLWLWHLPALYDLALRNPAVHVLEHATFSAAGVLYWWHLLSPIRGRLRLGGLGPVAYMISTKLGVGLLGIALTFVPRALYAYRGGAWGLTAETDQAVAGLIMAIEQSLVMGVALAWLFLRALGESEREELRAERYGARPA